MLTNSLKIFHFTFLEMFFSSYFRLFPAFKLAPQLFYIVLCLSNASFISKFEYTLNLKILSTLLIHNFLLALLVLCLIPIY